MKILHVTQPTSAGVARVVHQAVGYQAALGHDLVVASPEGELAHQLLGEGVEWRRWEAVRSPGPAVLAETRALRRIMIDVRPDVVHLHASKAGLAGRLAAPRGTRIVFQPHSWSFEATEGVMSVATRRWEVLAQLRTDATLWCSWGEQTVGLLAGVRAAGVVAMNGVDLTHFRPATPAQRAEARGVLGVPTGVLAAVVVGRLARQKGQDLVVEAWPVVRRRFPTAELLLLGDGPERGVLEASAGEGVRFLGDRPPALTAFHAADLAVLPSRWEGMSLAMIEGMACALPTVASDVSGAREALVAGTPASAGAVVPSDEASMLAAAVVERFADLSLRRSEGRAGRIRAERQFASESAMQTMISTYDLILSLAVPRGRRPLVPSARFIPVQRRGPTISVDTAPNLIAPGR